jgi:Mrp family chromosome partitioning ATPase
VKAPDPWLAARAANAIADAYLEHQVLERRAQRLQALDALAAQRDELNTRLKGLEQEIVRTRADSKLVFSEANDVSGNVFANIRQQLIVSEAELAAATAKREILDRARSAGAGASELSEVAFSALIQALRQRRMQAYVELAEAAEVYGLRHPEYLRRQESLAKIDGAIAQELQSLSATVRNEERVVLTKVAKLRQRMNEVESEATKDTGSKVRLARLQSEADAAKESLQRLGDQMDTISTKIGLEQAAASIVSRAVPPERPVFPNKLLIAGAASAAGAGLAFLFVAGGALRDKRIRTIAQLRSFEAISGYPVVAALPLLENDLDPANMSLESSYVRSVLGLATTTGIGSPEVGRVVVTPVQPGDGSTSLAVSLALLCRSRGLKTLLVELNADRAITRMFGGEGYPGLTDCSKQGIDPEAAIWITGEQGLHILGYGATDGELDYQTMDVIEQAFDRLFAHYDAVILDAPPLTSTKHTYRLMEEMDQVLVVTLPDGGRADILGYNLRSLAVRTAAKVAVIFNQVASNSELLAA